MAVTASERVPNVALISLREDAGLSQEDLAKALNDLAGTKYGKHPQITKKTIGRWERGEVEWPQPFYRRLLAAYFDCAVGDLGFRRPRRAQVPSPSGGTPEELLTLVASPSTMDPRVSEDQQAWRATRSALGKNRRALAALAERLYPDNIPDGLQGTGVITGLGWIPAAPIPLREINLGLERETRAPVVTGSEPESAQVRPLASIEQRYRRYSHAVRDVAAPRLFENRLCFRLMSVDWTQPNAPLEFGEMGFFDSIDTNEALAHETALHHLTADGQPLGTASWRRQSFRRLIGDPFDLARRPLMGAIGTLTIRAGESPSMILHQRDGDLVAGGGSMAHLVPAGIFQPSSVLPECIATDFSLWRNIQREYAEEMLGHNEYDGSGHPIDYANLEPFAAMDKAWAEQRIRVYCLGLTLDALTLAGDILTVAIFEPDTYDELFADAVEHNGEGEIPVRALPFEGNTIERLREMDCLSPGAAAAIHLAWQWRHALIAER